MINGCTMRTGAMRRKRMPTSVRIEIFTPEARAEIHSPSGTMLKNVMTNTTATTMSSTIQTSSIVVSPFTNSFVIYMHALRRAFHTLRTTMRRPSTETILMSLCASRKSPSVTTLSRTPSNSPMPEGRSTVLAFPTRPSSTRMSS